MQHRFFKNLTLIEEDFYEMDCTYIVLISPTFGVQGMYFLNFITFNSYVTLIKLIVLTSLSASQKIISKQHHQFTLSVATNYSNKAVSLLLNVTPHTCSNCQYPVYTM